MPDIPTDLRKPYDVRAVVRGVVDADSFTELQPRFAANVVIGFARVDGQSVGVVANQPLVLAGCLDIKSSIKGARLAISSRNSSPSSAMNAIKASCVVFSSAIFENACSVFTISSSGVCPWPSRTLNPNKSNSSPYFASQRRRISLSGSLMPGYCICWSNAGGSLLLRTIPFIRSCHPSEIALIEWGPGEELPLEIQRTTT